MDWFEHMLDFTAPKLIAGNENRDPSYCTVMFHCIKVSYNQVHLVGVWDRQVCILQESKKTVVTHP